MKFLAILKDSLREALDTKVFYVMVGFSLLLVLFVGSIGYRPVSVEEEAHSITDRMTWIFQRFGARQNLGAPPTWNIKDFERTQPNAAPWETGYRFALTVDFELQNDAEQARQVQKLSMQQIQDMLRNQFSYLKNLKVVDAKPKEAKEVRYLVTVEGSKTASADAWPNYPVFFFFVPIRFLQFPVGEFVRFWESWIVNWIGAAIALLISTIITAFFIPNMLRKGTVDMLVVKPISRPVLLLYKYVGGLTFMFLNTVVAIVGIWLMLGLRTNLWGTGFLLSIFVLTFQFALYYAVSTLFAVLTRSPIVSILMTCLFWFVFAFIIDYGYTFVDSTRKFNDIQGVQVDVADVAEEERRANTRMSEKPFSPAVYATADAIHLVVPHLKDLDKLTDKWILDDVALPDSTQRKVADKAYAGFRWTEAISVTSLYIAALLAVSCWLFARKDY